MTEAARDYSETLFLPKTDFPMRAGLPQKEPEILARWQELGLYTRLRTASRGRPKFILHDGTLYRGSKPVMWSVVEQTALAEAEVEYEDYVSDQIWVKFPLRTAAAHQSNADAKLVGASIVVWTTTPWTIPGNRAVSFSPRIE